MGVLQLPPWFLRIIVLAVFTLAISCRGVEPKAEYSGDDILRNSSCYDLSEDDIDSNVFYQDTIIVETTEELIEEVRSNRVVKLIDAEYHLGAPLVMDSINCLKIEGTGLSKVMIVEGGGTVIELLNSSNIHLGSLIVGDSGDNGRHSEGGLLKISHCYNVTLSDCKLLGAGTFGLYTYDVYNLRFLNSELTECTAFLFELEQSRNLEFRDSRFYDNELGVSVLGAFTNLTKEVTFSNCEFIDNTPAMVGNPAFNFMGNYENLEESVIFTNCTFRNNKGYKWYGDKIELIECQVDPTDFIYPEEEDQ